MFPPPAACLATSVDAEGIRAGFRVLLAPGEVGDQGQGSKAPGVTPPIPLLLSNQSAALAHTTTNQERRELRPEPAGAQRAQSRERAVVAPRPGGSSARAAAERRLGWGAGGGADLSADAGTLLTPTLVSTTRGRERPRRRRWTEGGAGREVLAPCVSEHRHFLPANAFPPEIQVGQGSFAVLSGEATTGVLGDSALPHPRSKSRPWRCAPTSGCSETGPPPGLSGALPAGQRPGAAWTPGFGWSFLRALPSNLQVTASRWDGELKIEEGGGGGRGKEGDLLDTDLSMR
ncbi:hypothetical protein LEMLEM_LOCUS4317 [Lemmus lemmus]